MLKKKNYEIKIIKIISLSIIMTLSLVYAAFAISGVGKNLKNDGSSLTDVSGNTIAESDYISITEAEISSSIKYAPDVFLNDSGDIQTSSHYDGSSDVQKSSSYDSAIDATTTSGIHWGYIWKSIEEMRSETDIMELRRCYEDIDSRTCSIPKYDLDSDKFFDIMNIVKEYTWTEHRQSINAYQLKAYEITVIGNNRVYTYLTFGRNESGRCFVFSSDDDKIAYLSEQDFEYIETIFLKAV